MTMPVLFDTSVPRGHPLTEEQGEALYAAARWLQRSWARYGIDRGYDWPTWQHILIVSNSVVRMMHNPVPIDWRYVQDVCAYALRYAQSDDAEIQAIRTLWTEIAAYAAAQPVWSPFPLPTP